MSGGGSQTIGYNYYVGMHMALCHGPIDKIKRIKVGDAIAFDGNLVDGSTSINEPDLFGGSDREGGIVGTLTLLKGTTTQTQNSYLMGKLGSSISAFRRVASVVLEHMNMGMNPYMKPWSFFGQRIHLQANDAVQWNDTYSQIDVTVKDDEGNNVTVAAMNPAHIIRECLVSPSWGLGYTDDDLNLTSFEEAALQLYNEGFGLCILWDTQTSMEDFVKLVLQHIDASVYIDRQTGLFCLKLIRDDYDVNDLLSFSEGNVFAIENQKQMTFGELTNTVTVNYHNVWTNDSAALTIQDLALIQVQEQEISTSITYEGIVDGVNASKVAQRDLKVLSTPFFSCDLLVTQVAKDLNVGSVFRFSWDRLGIVDMVMRITKISFGDDKDKKIRITATQDIYSFPSTGLVTPPSSGWQNPSLPPGSPSYSIAFELPYYSLVRSSSQSALDASLTENEFIGYVGGAAARNSSGGLAINGRLYTDNGAGYESRAAANFSPSGLLSADIGYLDTSITLANYSDLDQIEVNSWLQIGEELMGVVSVSAPTITVSRGVLDTTPALHSAGDPVFVWSEDFGIDPTEYVASDVVNTKMISLNSSGASSLGSATVNSVTLVGRAIKPFLPGRIQFDSMYYPDVETDVFLSDISMTWAHRNRQLQTGGTLVGFTDTSLTVEVGTTYEVRLYDSSDVLLHTYAGISGESQTILLSDAPVSDGLLTVQLDAHRDGHASYQIFEYTINVGILETTEDGFILTTEDDIPIEMETGVGGGGGGGGGYVDLGVTDSATGINSIVTMPTHAAGTLLVAYAFRDGSTTPPTVPLGWTTIDSRGSSSCSEVLAYKLAASESEVSGTWTNATGLIITAVDGSGTIEIGGNTLYGYLSSNIVYKAVTMDVTDGTSLILAFAGSRDPATGLSSPPSPLTNFESYSDGVNVVSGAYLANATSFSQISKSSGGSTTGFQTAVVEIKH
jgi:hypothetical protein